MRTSKNGVRETKMVGEERASDLEALERSEADLIELIELAAKIVDLDLSQNDANKTARRSPTHTSRRYTFKEQWILRWLIRRFMSMQAKSTDDTKPDTLPNYILDPRPWKLLLHLLSTIPLQSLTDLLLERKFVPQLNNATSHYLKSQTQANILQEDRIAEPPIVLNTERPAKRRRLSPPTSGTAVSSTPDSTLVQVCVICAEIGCVDGNDAQESSAPLWPSPDVCVTFVANSLSLVSTMLKNGLAIDLLAPLISTLLKPLESLRSAGTLTMNSSETHTFTRACLPICLELGIILKSFSGPAFGRARSAVEAQIARSTVLPLREHFRKKHHKQWKSQGGCVQWSHIRPFSKDLREHLALSENSTVAKRADYLFDIAKRLIPKYDIRTKQQEQPWADELLLGLAYFCCPGLPRLALNETVVVFDVIDDGSVNHANTLVSLFNLAAATSCPPSTEVVSYLAAAVVAWNDYENLWTSISSLVSIDSEAVMPDSQLPTAVYALSELVARMRKSEVTADAYALLRDHIVIPILRSFSASRALQAFVSIWRTELHESMWQKAGKDRLKPFMNQVWQDDLLFEEFQKQVASTTSTLAADTLLSELKTALDELRDRVGPTADIFATIAISTPVFGAFQWPLSKERSQAIVELLASATQIMQKGSDFQGQRWRLWNLIAAIQQVAPETRLSDSLVNEAVLRVSLANVEKHALQVTWTQECLCQFIVLGLESLNGSDEYRSVFQKELGHLLTLVKLERARSTVDQVERSWTGQSLTISNTEQLLCACLGVLLANPDLVHQSQDFANGLFTTAVTGLDRGNTSILSGSVDETARLSLDASESSLFKHIAELHRASAQSSVPAALRPYSRLNKLATQRLRPAYLRASAEKQFELLKNAEIEDAPNAEGIDLSDAGQILTFLNWVGVHAAVTYTRVDHWSAWKQISRKLSQAKDSPSVYDFLLVSRSMQDAVELLMRAVADSDAKERPAKMNSIFEHTNAFLKERSKAAHKPYLTDSLFELHTAQWVCSNGTSSEQGDGNLAKLQASLMKLVARDLHSLANTTHSENLVAPVLVLLEVATKIAETTPQPEEFCDASRRCAEWIAHVNLGVTGNVHLRQRVYDQCKKLESMSPPAAAGGESVEKVLHLADDFVFDDGCGHWSDYKYFGARAVYFVSELEPRDYTRCLELCSRTADSAHGPVDQFVVAAIVRRIREEDVVADERLLLALNDLACLSTKSPMSSSVALLKLENANLILVSHPQLISQATIDQLLSGLCQFGASGITTHANGNFPSHVLVDRICSTIGTLLGRFRRRLADRYHLLLPVLQHILRCFFYSPDVERRARQPTVMGSNPESLLRALPAWLKNSKSVLPASSATNLSRILSSICNPTVSAAISSRRGPGGRDSKLNDETKRVKTLAGQHMQYLVMEYCRCTLDGDIASEVKEKLMPGMYAILDSMSRDLMRSMNANMDPSSRAIFKRLYDDWVKYGKWDKS